MGTIEGEIRRGLQIKTEAEPSITEQVRVWHMRCFLVTLLLGISVLLSLTTALALGFDTNVFKFSFGAASSTPVNPYPLSNPSEVAVDNSAGPSAGDVYVTDPANHRVEKFSSSGAFILMFGKDVNETTGGNVCTAESHDICQTGTSGSSPGEFDTPTFIAVDDSSGESTGDIYVGDIGDDKVSKFEPGGSLISTWGTEGQLDGSTATDGPFGRSFGGIATSPSGELVVVNDHFGLYRFAEDGSFITDHSFGPDVAKDGLAVGSAENIFFVKPNGAVVEVSFSGSTVSSEFAPGPATGVTIGPSGDLYVSYSDHIAHYGSSGEFLDEFGSGTLTLGAGLSLDKFGNVYVADSGNGDIAVYKEVVLPNVTTGPLTNQVQTSGTFTGNIDPLDGGEITSCHFQYVTEAAFNTTGFSDLSSGGELPCEPPIPITSATEVTANFSGLSSNTPYVYRLIAGNASGTNSSAQHLPFVLQAVADVKTQATTDVTSTSAQLNGSFVGDGEPTEYLFEWGTNYENRTPVELAGSPNGPGSTTVSFTLLDHTLIPETEYHYRIVASNAKGASPGEGQSFTTAAAVAELRTTPATNFTPTSAQLNGSFVGNGEGTHYYFEWGKQSEGYTNTTPVPPGELVPGGVGLMPASVFLTGLSPLTPYNFRIVATNGEGMTLGNNEPFELPLLPLVSGESTSDVRSDSALLHAQISPGGGDTKFHFEYASEEEYIEHETYGNSIPVPDIDAGSGLTFADVSPQQLGNLKPGTTYHWRVVAENASGTTDGSDSTFTTYPFTPVLVDRCPNAHVRQQTGSAELLDCRAYELVSAGNSGGYDVESNLVAGQVPYGGYPQAENPPRVLYAVNDGGIPGTDNPTNRGPDPYIATRGEDGWTTEYVGVPANNPFANAPFSSIPSGADASLDAFAFGGSGGCSPCFEGGYTGIPVRLANGKLVQGMVPSPSVPAPGPTASPEGYIAKDLSANGEHLIFGSTSKFAEGGNSNGEVSIYDRNLKTEETHVVSNSAVVAGQPLPCPQGAGECDSTTDSNGISELDISEDGSHVLLGQKVATDKNGNVDWRLFMDVGDNEKTIELTPGASEGVLYDGMTTDGSRIFFTTKEQLLPAGTPSGANLYEVEVAENGTATLHLIAAGSGSCEPVANKNGSHWNTVGSGENCGAVAIGGGGGVAETDGTIYFLSPEQLEAGDGTQNQPNLYVARPGSSPHFVATLASNDPLVLDSVKEAESRKTADFQVTPNGDFAVFGTTQPLTKTYENAGHSEIYRYDASTDTLDCVSCDPTGVEPSFDSTLASNGLSLTDPGQVFFTTDEPLAARDQDEKKDVYEWETQGTGTCQPESPDFVKHIGDCISLISAGTSPFDSGLLSASAAGTDVYFFTRDSLAPQDHNGPTMKIYDARTQGGFPFEPPPIQCKASDECHGPGTQAPGQPNIRSIAGTPGNYSPPINCRPGFIKKHGKCVKRPPKPKRHRRAAHRRRGGSK
jgi:hypothetical protein